MKKKVSVSGEKSVSRTRDLEPFVGGRLLKEPEIHHQNHQAQKEVGRELKEERRWPLRRKKNEQAKTLQSLRRN